jgi:hypothetical protein
VLVRQGVEIGGLRPARVERHKNILAACRRPCCIRGHWQLRERSGFGSRGLQ